MVIGKRNVVAIFWPLMAFLWWLPAETKSAEKLLRWKFTAGESLKYQLNQTTQTATSGTGKAMRILLETSMTVTWTVDSVDADKTASITQTIDTFRVSMKTDKLDPIVYDSTSKNPATGPAREIAEPIGKLVGKSCRIQMTDRGEITLAELSDPLKRALESTSKDAGGNPFAPAEIANSLRQVAVVLPEKPVMDGGTWESQQEVATPLGTILQRQQFKYHGQVEFAGAMQDKCTLTANLTLNQPAERGGAVKIKEGEQSGTMWFDSAAGRFVSSEVTQKLVTERPYRDTAIQVESTSTLSLKLVP